MIEIDQGAKHLARPRTLQNHEPALGPDGFIGSFYKECWDIIKHRHGDQGNVCTLGSCWNLLNSAHITLIEKKDEAQAIGDYCPISVMHSIAKLLAKILTIWLANHLDKLVSRSQSTFIKGRNIHDNFQYVQGAFKHFHQAKTSMLLLKLDITKAFDNVRWEYLLELMEQLGFGQRSRDILSLIWSSTTSRIMLNGALGRPIRHYRGLHQGGPLSPMLFIFAMDPIQRMLDLTTQEGLLTPIGAETVKMRTSLYADDDVPFLRPNSSDVSNIKFLLEKFGQATGLSTNFQKSEVFPIRCDTLNISGILDDFQVRQGQLPCKYLGLPLRLGHIRREDEQILIDGVKATKVEREAIE
jgi:hypothetical protein